MNSRHFHSLISVWMFVCCFVAPHASAGEVRTAPASEIDLQLGSVEPLDRFGGFIIQSVAEALFADVGAAVSIRHCPAMRCTAWIIDGTLDGVLLRGQHYMRNDDLFIRVDPSVFRDIPAVAYSARDDLDLEMLLDTPGRYRIIYRHGAQDQAELLISQGFLPEQLVTAHSVEQALSLLRQGRADAYVAVPEAAHGVMTPVLLRDQGFRMLGILSRLNLHLYVHAQHRHLVPALSKALAGIHDRGSIGEIMRQARQQFGIEPQP